MPKVQAAVAACGHQRQRRSTKLFNSLVNNGGCHLYAFRVKITTSRSRFNERQREENEKLRSLRGEVCGAYWSGKAVRYRNIDVHCTSLSLAHTHSLCVSTSPFKSLYVSLYTLFCLLFSFLLHYILSISLPSFVCVSCLFSLALSTSLFSLSLFICSSCFSYFYLLFLSPLPLDLSLLPFFLCQTEWMNTLQIWKAGRGWMEVCVCNRASCWDLLKGMFSTLSSGFCVNKKRVSATVLL